MARFLLVLSLALVFIGISNALCVERPSKHIISGRVAILQTSFDRSCPCPSRSDWICYVPRGGEACSPVKCQKASSITQIYGLFLGTTYDAVIGGVCEGESIQLIKNLLCNTTQVASKYSFESLPAKPTSRPEDVSTLPLTHHDLQVCWGPPAFAGQNGRITNYLIKCSGCGQDTYTISSEHKCTVITGLTPFSTVSVSVSAENVAGSGPYSTPVSAVMKVDTPGNAPTLLSVGNQGGKSINLLWSHPLKDRLLGGPLTGYVVEVTNNKLGNVSLTRVRFEGRANRTYNMAGLQPLTTYKVRVAGTNRFGIGKYSEALYITTLEDVPDGPPSSVEAELVNNSVVMVTCLPPPPDVANGEIVGYVIEFCPCNSDSCTDSHLTSNTNEIWIRNLQAQTMYCVRAAARTKIGMGPWTKPITVLTNMAAPPPPVEVRITDIQANSANVCWSSPDTSNVMVSVFEVRFRPRGKYYMEVMNMGEVVIRVPVVNSQRQYCTTLKGLEENAKYQARVYAINSIGESKAVQRRFKTKKMAPSGPPTNVTVDCEQSALTVHWCVPDKESRNGIIKQFTVELSCSGEPTTSVTVDKKTSTSCAQYLFGNLTPGRLYTVKVQAVNEVGTGPFCQPVDARTKEDFPGAPRLLVPRTGDHSAFILYSQPLQSNGVILRYTLTLTPSSPDCFEEKVVVLTGSVSSSSIYSVYGLTSGVQYRVCMAAENSYGIGPKTCVTKATSGDTPVCPASETTTATTEGTTPTTEGTTPTTEATTRATTPPTTGATTPPTTRATTPSTTGATTPPTTRATTPPTTRATTPSTTGATTPPTTKPTTPPTTGATTPPTTKPTTPPTTRATTPPTTKPTTPPTTRATTPPTTKPTTPPTTRATTPPTTKPTTPPTTRATTPPTTRATTPPTTRATTPPTTKPTTPSTEPTLSPQCGGQQDGITALKIGTGILLRWADKCDSALLTYTNALPGATRSVIRLGKRTRLFFLTGRQLGGRGTYSFCVEVRCGSADCQHCTSVSLSSP